jgi:hypothetical protein
MKITPTVQFLSLLEAQGEPVDVRKSYAGRWDAFHVKGLQELGSVIAPTEVEIRKPSLGLTRYVSIDEIENLPKNFEGLWEPDNLTGTFFTGDAEQSTRLGSKRVASQHEPERVSVIPYTDDELDKIRQYILSKTGEGSSELSISTLLIYAVNAVAVATLCVFFYRKHRYG